MKQCKRCKEHKKTDFYHKQHTSKDGYRSTCKFCIKTYEEIRYKEKKENISIVQKDYYLRNTEKISLRKKKYYFSNRKIELARMALYTKTHKEERASYYLKYRDKNVEKIALYYFNYNKKYAKEIAIYNANYVKNNLGKYNSHVVKRNAAKLGSTPPWITKDHIKEIEDLYCLAKELQWLSEESLEVDHIIPLQGKNVCGLHIPINLQILTRSVNRQKSNKFDSIEYNKTYFPHLVEKSE